MEWIPIIKKLPPKNTDIIYCTTDSVKFGYLSGYVWWHYSINEHEKVSFEKDRVVAWMHKPNIYGKTTD